MQSQRAGENASQIQIHGDFVLHQGITEARAAEISRAVSVQVAEKYTQEAQDIALSRIAALNEKVVSLLAEASRLGSFGDPAFQVALRHAQIGAASSDSEVDYDILAGLLKDHSERAEVRPIRAAIGRAIEVVDQLDATALRALTVHAALEQYSPMSGILSEGLSVLDALHASLAEDQPLPEGGGWIEHLDLLDAVRTQSGATFVKYQDYFPSLVPGYVAMGLKGESEELEGAIARWDRTFNVKLIPHELKPGYFRFPSSSANGLKAQIEAVVPAPEVASAIDHVVSEFRIEPDLELFAALRQEIRDRTSFGAAADWWDLEKPYFRLTLVGRVLARSNAARLYAGQLPPID